MCFINRNNIPDGVIISDQGIEISEQSDDFTYEEGYALTIGCPGKQLLTTIVSSITCLSNERWRPDYRSLRCI